MELERPLFPLLCDTLKYLDAGVSGKVTNVVKNKNNKFILHVLLPTCGKLNIEDMHLAFINEDVIQMSNVQPGLLLGCLHPLNKKWMRCYVISIVLGEAHVALCDTGEITKTKILKNVPDRFRNIPAITFEAEVMCICPLNILQHLMENLHDYTAVFETFKSVKNIETHRKMRLTRARVSIDFIIKKWDLENYMNTNCVNNDSLMFQNGCAVVLAKANNYDWRHIFVRSVDQFANVCKELQSYCKHAQNIQRSPAVGDIVAVKCINKFYRGKIIDILDKSCFYLYLIDSGFIIEASIDSLVDLSVTLQKIPSTVCLVGLESITLKPWTPETSLYITSLFENSVTMIMEYTNHNSFGLDSVTLTSINKNEDVNGRMKELLKSVEDCNENEYDCLNPVHDLNLFIHLKSNSIIPVKIETQVISGSKVMPEHTVSSLIPGCTVYMTGFVSLDEIYIRKLEDHNDEFEKFLDLVNDFCSSATPINRPLIIGEIVGAQSTLDENYYRAKVLKQIDNLTYFTQFIDFGDKDNVPVSNIFEIPEKFMIPTNVMKITLKGVTNSPMNADALKYISNLLSNYTPMIIDFSPLQPLKNVTLTTLDDNEKVNEQLIKLLNITSSTTITKKTNSPASGYYCEESLPKLKLGDSVYITLFNDVHHIFVRKVEEYEAENVEDFIASVDSYCSSAPPIGKLPKLNDIIGARAIDGSFYRAKVVKKVNDVSYNVQLIDFGIEENVELSNIVSLSSNLTQVVPSIVLVKLKGLPLTPLNAAAHEYVNYISENETLIVDFIEDSTNEVILKTDKNVINDHLHMLLFGNDKKSKVNSSVEVIKEECKFGGPVQSIPKCISVSIHSGCTVYMTAFVDLNEIYIRKLEDYNDEFHTFLDKVNDFCQSATPINGPLAIGEIVGAQLALDNSFYRGKVLKQVDDASYLIHFIDFGDKENVSVSNLFRIPKEFMVLSTIMKITLKGIKQCPLNVKTSAYISNLLATYEPMTIDFDTKFPLKDVTLTVVNSNENVAECLNKLLEEEVDVIADTKIMDTKYFQEPQVTQEEEVVDDILSINCHVLKSGDVVYITAYIDLANIYVRKVDTHDELQKLNQRVNDYCFLGSAVKNMSPELNQIVGAKSSADRSFYRAKVIEKTDEYNLNVLFIDFGFEENVNVADIVFLPSQLQQVIPSISLVGLKGSTFENLEPEDHEYLEELILLNEKMKIEFEDLNAVTLIIVNQELNIMDYLNKLHENDSSLNDTIIDNSIQHTSSMKYISHDISIPEIPPLSNQSIVTIHAFVSLKSIYVSVCFDKSLLNKFVKDFAEYCLISKPIITNPVIGQIYGIKSSTDGWFYRGSVVEKLNAMQYSVVFFDLGNKDIVSANNFVEICEQLKQVPQSIYCVSLKGINSENLNDQAISYVNMLCENMPLVIEFDENNPNALSDVTLTTVKTQQNVNYHLATLLTEKDRDSPETVQKLSKGDIVYISSFINLRTVYIRLINNGTDKFKSFIENLSSCCALNNPIEKEPNVGEIIAAKEKSSAKFYRAEVISKVDNEHFKVCFIDFGSREIVHKHDVVELTESQVNNCPPTFMVGLKGFDSEPVKPKVLQYIKKISDAETFIIDYINEQNKVVLISVNMQRNINKEIKKLIDFTEPIIKNEINVNDVYNDVAKSVIKYSSLNLGIPIQVWVAEKFSSSRYSVHTHDSRAEFIRLEKQMFDDSKGFVTIKHVKVNMPCIVYFSPSWYRGTILEVIDQFTAKIGLLDVGNYSVVRNIKEIFCMPSKYSGKSLLINIEIQPEPLEKLAFTSFKIVPKQCLDNGTIIVGIVDSSIDQSYDDLDNMGLPSFSSTPIPEDSDRSFCLNSLNEENSPTIMCDQQNGSSSFNLSNKQLNILTIKDVQYAKWLPGSSKTLTVLCTYQDCLVMRDHMIDDSLTDLETKIQSHCLTIEEPYCPAENELCLAKYCDELWYRAICIKTASMPNEHSLMVYFLDWGIEYSVIVGDVRKMSKDFVYLPATAHKCYVEGLNASEWSADTMTAVAEYMLTQVNCVIVEKLSSDTYTILCDTIKNLIDTKLQ